MGHPPLYVTFSVLLSVCLSVCLSFAYHISGTMHHVIIIFGTDCKMMISPGTCFIFVNFLIFLECLGCEKVKMAQKEKQKCYLSCAISQEQYYDFWYTGVKWSYLNLFFLIFSNHWFSRSLVGYKGKKWSKMTRSSVCCTQYFRNSTWYDCHMWYTSLKWCLQFFFVFHFFKILIFFVVSGVKGQIMVQNYKFCPSHSIFQEQYIIYGAHV